MSKVTFSQISFGLGAFLAASLVLSGCAGTKNAQEPSEPKISEAELRAYCPSVSVDPDAAYYNIYSRGGEGDSDKVVYQAVISTVTRACKYPSGQITMDVAAAGRVVPGPQMKSGTITMPLYVQVLQGTEVIYSKKHKYPVTLTSPNEATQFIFKDNQVTFPMPSAHNVKVIVGFDVPNGAKAKAKTK